MHYLFKLKKATLIRVKRSFRQFNLIAYQISLDGLFVSLEAVTFFDFLAFDICIVFETRLCPRKKALKTKLVHYGQRIDDGLTNPLDIIWECIDFSVILM